MRTLNARAFDAGRALERDGAVVRIGTEARITSYNVCYTKLLRFDMGGTTAKSCLIQNGSAGVVPTFEVGRVQRFMKGSGLTIQVPVVDLMEIGAA